MAESHLPTRLELAERALRDLNSWCGDIETSTLTVADVQKVVRSTVAAHFENVNLGIYAGGLYDDDPRVKPIEPEVFQGWQAQRFDPVAQVFFDEPRVAACPGCPDPNTCERRYC